MPRIGETPCCNPACGCTDATVNRTAGGKLQSKCHKCGTERWAPVGTKAHRDLMAQTRLDDDVTVDLQITGTSMKKASVATENVAPGMKTEKPARTASAFSLGNL